MEITLAILISIISLGMTVINFFTGREDKSNTDVAKDSYKMGQIEERLNTISKQIEEISNKLDVYENEIDKRIEKAMNTHIDIYHKN